MTLKAEKYVRFQDSSSENSFTLESDHNNYNWPRTEAKKTILDPQGPFLQRWNKIFVLSCIIAVSLDPLFFYIPVIKSGQFCFDLDKKMEITACVLRSVVDIFCIFHILLQFRTGFIAPSSPIFGRGELVEDSKAIAKRYIFSYFIIDILSILPLPQVVILMARHTVNGSVSHVTKELLKVVIFIQYIPRIWRIYPFYKEATAASEVAGASGIFTESAWAGAAFNLILYMLASHVIGACWYLFSVERKEACWREVCGRSSSCNVDTLYCREAENNNVFLNSSCLLLEQNELNSTHNFDFGIALDALRAGVVEHGTFSKKFLYCFWWGLRNLSSLGQNLKTSTFAGDILLAIAISVIGLILFALFISNMQKYLESITATSTRVEEMRVKRRDTEYWMSHRILPEQVRERVRRYEQHKWKTNRSVEEESLIRNLPNDLRRDITRHVHGKLLARVPMFKKMDEQVLDALCSRMKPVLYTSDSIIVREGDPVDEMLFIMSGELLMTTARGFFEQRIIAGDFFGKELLTWALDLNSSSSLPISIQTVKALTDVEAFCLMPDDLKNLGSHFSKQLRQTLRFYSPQWRDWGACFIQAAWRRYYRRKVERELREAGERGMHGGLQAPTLGAAIYASRFANNMIGNLRRSHEIVIVID